MGTLRSIYREAGVRGLYAGLPVTMVIAVPANVLYFATYEGLRDLLQQKKIPQPGGGERVRSCEKEWNRLNLT